MNNKTTKKELRDFLYFDIELIKSIFSQMNSGLVDNYTKTNKLEDSTTGDGKLKLKTPIFEIGTGISKEISLEDIQSNNYVLSDYIYNILEDQLRENDSLIFIDKIIERKELKKLFLNNKFFLLDGYIEIKNMDFIMNFANNFSEISKLMGANTNNKKNYEEEKNIKKTKIMLENFFPYEILLKCYHDKLDDYNFSTNVNRKNFRDNIENIVYNYTSIPENKWKILGQVMYIPEKNVRKSAKDIETTELFNAIKIIFDAATEVEYFSSVAYPEVSFKPLAIYRNIS